MNKTRIASILSRSFAGRGTNLLSGVMALMAVAALVFGSLPTHSLASSHREAPFISGDPEADNTDVYAFVSPGLTNTVTLVANYIPLQPPAAGPNFYPFGPDVLYEIKIDNTGNGEADVTYQFTFSSVVTEVEGVNTFLYNNNQITNITDAAYLHKQFYDVTRVENGTSTVVASNKLIPPANIGPRSTPNYATLAAQAVYSTSNGGKVFAGSRDDAFFVDLGSIFDLGGLRPLNNLHIIPEPVTAGVDGVAGYNVNSLVLQVPMTDLTAGHAAVNSGNSIVGVWATASRQSTRVLRTDGTQNNSGRWVQVSRLGNPLINEVIIPTFEKDYWNASYPSGDKYFAHYYTDPNLVPVLNFLYPALDDANTTGRADLVGVLLTGLPGFNFTGNTKADMLRLNMAIAPNTNPSRLGPLDPSRTTAATADLSGFPNGRRLADDVVDIELRALLEGYGPFLAGGFGVPNRTPNNTVVDGLNTNDKPFLTAFPYLSTPWSGYEAEPPSP